MNYIIKEDQLHKLYKILKEEIDLDDFSREDFFEIFLDFFRDFLKEHLGDKFIKAPLSFYVKRYIHDFIKKYKLEDKAYGDGADEDSYDHYSFDDFHSLAEFGKYLVELGYYELPNLYKNEPFLKRFGKKLDFLIQRLELPDFIQLNITENDPYKLDVEIIEDFEKKIKSKEDVRDSNISSHTIQEKLKQNIEDFLGVSIGNRSHGELELNTGSFRIINMDEWIKNVYRKVIRKKLAAIKGIEKVTFYKPKSYYDRPKITYKLSRGIQSFQVRESIREILSENGLNPAAFELDTTW